MDLSKNITYSCKYDTRRLVETSDMDEMRRFCEYYKLECNPEPFSIYAVC
ncbi:hypothetical protein BMW23_0997 [Bodo saltans virus]|uniref:Uncharacterized protein n=1 Tax=Bodo saltans virus TaxID=2024608 RepID=A0A2H4UVT4_9VIRU|nr:hypothetical protein QJ851_gp0979 [Bodo saltans virus]ATZ81042.1 hypothetical protein BMW23_0997 [Bodo saltans virus]